MSARPPRKPRPALDPSSLHELALAYVGRFATTRSKLVTYLRRKLRERGWAESHDPDIEALAERFSGVGLIDDAAFALAKAQSLTRRGYGKARLSQQLRGAGVEPDDGKAALDLAAAECVAAALKFAERRRFGPFATSAADRDIRQRQLAAMVRAGHPFALSLAILRRDPGDQPDPDDLKAEFSHTGE